MGHHRYLVVCDRVTGRVSWAAKSRSTEAVNAFFDVFLQQGGGQHDPAVPEDVVGQPAVGGLDRGLEGELC